MGIGQVFQGHTDKGDLEEGRKVWMMGLGQGSLALDAVLWKNQVSQRSHRDLPCSRTTPCHTDHSVFEEFQQLSLRIGNKMGDLMR